MESKQQSGLDRDLSQPLGGMSIDQTTAQELNRVGATLLLLDVPPGTEFGVDLVSWTVASRFRGMKMVPPGIHYVYYMASPKEQMEMMGVSSRQGFFCELRQGEVMVRRWDAQTESLVPLADADEAARYEAGVRRMEFDSGLAPYPLDTYARWLQLSRFLTSITVRRIQPAGLLLRTDFPNQQQRQPPQQQQQQQQQQQHEQYRVRQADAAVAGLPYHYSVIPKVVPPPNATPQEVTRFHMDKSPVLEELLRKSFAGAEKELVAETQFSFLTFYLGHSYEGFEEWKARVILLCSCEAALLRYAALYAWFLEALVAALQEAPADLFHDPLSRDNFLQSCLRNILDVTAAMESDGDVFPDGLRQAISHIKKLARRKFNWDFDTFIGDRDDEYAPVIVDEVAPEDQFTPLSASFDVLNLQSQRPS